jgi:energy-coupling factor transporter ATP-binding protein EcfA2
MTERRLVDDDQEVGPLNEVEVPARFHTRISAGSPVLDEIFGGGQSPGIVPGTSIFLTGGPGSGKSTLSMQLADWFHTKAGHQVLYNLGEESKQMARFRAVNIGLDADFSISAMSDVNDLVKYAKKSGVEVLFQDSLQRIGDRTSYRSQQLVEAAIKLHRLAKDEGVTVFIVGHCNKKGVFAGPRTIQHDLDVHLHIEVGDDVARKFRIEKNRFGPAGSSFEIVMTGAGLQLNPADSIFSQETGRTRGQSNAAAARRGEIREAIVSLLRDGERLSGYCYERLGVPCSGGYWRSVLREACELLAREGAIVAETTIDRRGYFYLRQPPPERAPAVDPVSRALLNGTLALGPNGVPMQGLPIEDDCQCGTPGIIQCTMHGPTE